MNSDNISDQEILEKFISVGHKLTTLSPPSPKITDFLNITKEIGLLKTKSSNTTNPIQSVDNSEMIIPLQEISSKTTIDFNPNKSPTLGVISNASDEEEMLPIPKITKKIGKKIIKKMDDDERKLKEESDVKSEEEKLIYLQGVLKETEDKWEEDMNYIRDIRDFSSITPEIKHKIVYTIKYLLESNDKIRSLGLRNKDLQKESSVQVILKMFKYLYNPIGQTFMRENIKFLNTVSDKVQELKNDLYLINGSAPECLTLLQNFENDILVDLKLNKFEKEQISIEDRVEYYRYKKALYDNYEAFEEFCEINDCWDDEETAIIVLINEFKNREIKKKLLNKLN